MILLIEKYEQEHFPSEPPEAVEANKFRMDQMGLTAKDLFPVISRKNRIYKVLNSRRALTLPMIRNLHKMFNIPLASLVGAAENSP